MSCQTFYFYSLVYVFVIVKNIIQLQVQAIHIKIWILKKKNIG